MKTQPMSMMTLKPPYYQALSSLSQDLESDPDRVLMLAFSDYGRFQCATSGSCCKGWQVQIDREYYAQWEDHWNQHSESRFHSPFVLSENSEDESFAHLRKQQDGVSCVFLQDDNLCFIHSQLGESAKPSICQTYPQKISASANGYATMYTLKSCHAAPTLMLQDPKIYYHCFESPPQPLPPADAGTTHELRRADQYKWLGLVLDLLDQGGGSLISRFAQILPKMVHISENHFVSGEDIDWSYLHQLPQQNAPISGAAEIQPLIDLLKHEFNSLYRWLVPQISHLKLSEAQRQQINPVFWVYLRQKLVTQVYTEPAHRHLSWAQHHLVLGLLLLTQVFYALYLSDQAKEPLNQQHLIRAMQVVERKLGHGRKWLVNLQIDQKSDAEAIAILEAVLGLAIELENRG